MKRLLSSGALVFKSTIMREFGCSKPDDERAFIYAVLILQAEWWNQRAQPWLHYVPVKVDYSDLYDTVAFVSVTLA
jgi:hypothetical protein